MKVKTSELTGPALDWVIAACERVYVPARLRNDQLATWFLTHWTAKQGGMNYSTDWSQGGPIIEKMMGCGLRLHTAEFVTGVSDKNLCVASVNGDVHAGFYFGKTPLVAAMRCYVASKLGDEVEIPDELLES